MDVYIPSIKVGRVRGFPSGGCGAACEEGSCEEVGVLVGSMRQKSGGISISDVVADMESSHIYPVQTLCVFVDLFSGRTSRNRPPRPQRKWAHQGWGWSCIDPIRWTW